MLKDIFKQIKKYDNIVITRHIGVDPDALASQLALRDSIRKTFPDKKVLAVGSSSVKFNYFPKLDKMEELSDAMLIVVDTPDKKRIDVSNFDDYKYYVKLDHHPFIEEFANIEYIDDKASSASEVIYRLITSTGLVLDEEIAKTLFLGIVSDTNRFLFSSSSKTFAVVSEMLDKFNLDLPKLYSNIFMRPLNEVRLQGYIAENMKVTENGLASVKITNDTMLKYGVDVGSAGNLVNNFNYIEEVIVWVTVSEDVKNNLIKLNIRSRGPIINHIAEKYNGGGHHFASGARVTSMAEADSLLEELDDACRNYIEKLGDRSEN
jgi:phosphoesterase RecJ-like protein